MDDQRQRDPWPAQQLTLVPPSAVPSKADARKHHTACDANSRSADLLDFDSIDSSRAQSQLDGAERQNFREVSNALDVLERLRKATQAVSNLPANRFFILTRDCLILADHQTIAEHSQAISV
jgi:hypothetical protein